MQQYKNISKMSGVVAFEIGERYIRIRYKNRTGIYTYDYSIPGKDLVEKMKLMAVEGRGLNRFIGRHVGKNYRDKSGE